MTKQLDDALGLNSLPTVYTDHEVLPAAANGPVDEQVENDATQAREGLYDALTKSQAAVEDMMSIAQQSQHPKAYEILNQAIKTMADISMGLVDLQIKKQRLVGKPADQKVVNNNLFVGSTAELQKMLDQLDGTEEED